MDDTSSPTDLVTDDAAADLDAVMSEAEGPTPEAPAVPAPVAASAEAPASVATGDRKKILIVEDERPLAHALELKLNHDGYETVTARTGTEGLKEAKTGQYHLMLLDLILPELDGFTILQELQSMQATMPIVILSNLGQEEDKERTGQYNIAQYCVKSNMPLAAIVNAVKTYAV